MIANKEAKLVIWGNRGFKIAPDTGILEREEFNSAERMVATDNLPLDDLTDKCVEETERFRRRQDSVSRHCLELFRLAFEEKQNEAYAALNRVFGKLVYSWVHRHPMFSFLNNWPADYIVADSTSNFFLAMEDKPFDHFDSVAALLKYWKLCVDSVIKGACRKQERQVLAAPLDDARILEHHDPVDERLMAAQIWARVEAILDEDDCLLARYICIQDLKPSEIINLADSKWKTTEEVRVARQRIMRKLKNDPTLRRLLGING